MFVVGMIVCLAEQGCEHRASYKVHDTLAQCEAEWEQEALPWVNSRGFDLEKKVCIDYETMKVYTVD